ncbi:MAG: hypothetical protein ABIP51_05080 [Bacteroidia bacterium]
MTENNKIIYAAANKCKHLECDGTVKVLTYIMNENGIKHSVFMGTVEKISNDDIIPLHFWIELPDGMTVDFKCRMWLGKDSPNGVFNKKDFPDYVYKGEAVNMPVKKIIYQVLTNDFS